MFKQEGLYIAVQHLPTLSPLPPSKKPSKVGRPQVTVVQSMLSLTVFFPRPLKEFEKLIYRDFCGKIKILIKFCNPGICIKRSLQLKFILKQVNRSFVNV